MRRRKGRDSEWGQQGQQCVRRRYGSGDSEDFELFGELPRREGGVLEAFVDPKIIVGGCRCLLTSTFRISLDREPGV
jgi:hypothetical protein